MEKQEIRTFGRRHGKKLSARKLWLIENVLPNILPTSKEKNLILEIGFGAGEHLRTLALEHPNKTIIGAEPFVNGVAALLSAITDERNGILPQYKNIRIWPDDVRQILIDSQYLFEEIWILHPDPWPKARHEKRRLLQPDFIKLLLNRLAPSGQIIIGTDHWGYFDWIKEKATKSGLTFSEPDLHTIQTRYQRKNMAETNRPKYLIFEKPQI